MFFIVLSLIISPKVNAECSAEQKANLKKLASNIQFVYYPYDENNDVRFRLIIANSSEFYLYNDEGLEVGFDSYGNHNEIRLNNLLPGKNYTFYFYSTSSSCYGTEVYRKTISLPNYNQYYKDPVCNGKEDYYLCNKWQLNSLSYDEFVNKVNSYTKETSVKEVEPIVEDEQSIFDLLLQFYLKYYWLVLGLIIAGSVTGIVILNKKDSLIG